MARQSPPDSALEELQAVGGEEEEPLDVLDLPQLYQKPSATTLLSVLDDLSFAPPSWETPTSIKRRKVKSEGVPAYLTKIVSSPLTWIEEDDVKERIWEAASQRLSERSGRTGMGNITRTFNVPLGLQENENVLEVVLHEPALSGDNLGLKTWAASFLLAKRLPKLRSTLPALPKDARILELGAGTGLVGLAAAAVLKKNVVLTDLPEIVENLERNVETNTPKLQLYDASASAAILDWTRPADFTITSAPNTFPLILAADPIYSSDHPKLLVQALAHHLAKSSDARAVIELPLRDAYAPERLDLGRRLAAAGLRVLEEGEEVGYDDWRSGSDGDELAEVRCWWSVWAWG